MAATVESIQGQVKHTKLSVLELAHKLSLSESITLKKGDTLSFSDLDLSDFFAIVNEEDNLKKLGVLQQIMNRCRLILSLEGSLALGALNLDDRSWTLMAGDSGSLTICAKPLPVRLSLQELVLFLKKLPLGQALVLKPNQDLLLEGFSQESVTGYFEFCQNTTDVKVLEKAQDEFFTQANELLKQENLTLKMYALEASMMNREVNPMLGQILFKPQGDETRQHPRMMAALIKAVEA
jgi:hypothetical protein